MHLVFGILTKKYSNVVEDEAENKIQTVIESETEWEKDGWNKKVRANSLVFEGKTALAITTKEKAGNKFLTSEQAIMFKAWGYFTELTGWNLIGTYRTGTIETTYAWILVSVVISCCFVVVLGAERELPLKKGKLWVPGLKWELKNSLYSGNPFDLVATVTFRHESGKRGRPKCSMMATTYGSFDFSERGLGGGHSIQQVKILISTAGMVSLKLKQTMT